MCGRPAEVVSEENYFFKLSAFQERLLKLYEEQPDFLRPAFRRNEILRFVEAGLRDISVSRKTVKWGLPWPEDPEHVVYVWYDALTSYLSGIGYGDDEMQYEKYWPAQLHLIGKEIIRFHCVYWPAFLWAAGEQLPKGVFAHGWLLFDQQKMSKSKGNVAYAEPIARVLGEGCAALLPAARCAVWAGRQFQPRRAAYALQQRPGEWAGQSRQPSLDDDRELLRRGKIQLPISKNPRYSTRNWMVADILRNSSDRPCPLRRPSFLGRPREDLGGACRTGRWISYPRRSLGSLLRTMLTAHERLENVLYDAAETIRIIVVLAHPALPNATAKIWEQLGQPGALAEIRIGQLERGALMPGTQIGELAPAFPRVEKKEALEKIMTLEGEMTKPQTEKAGARASRRPQGAAAAAAGGLRQRAPAAAAAGGRPRRRAARIGIEDFAKVEMRVGEVKSAERVAGADKLLKLMVDIGDEVRQVVAGIATVYAPEKLVGRKVVVVTNLQPRKLRGVESNGMILAASAPDGSPVLAAFLEDVPVGARLK